MLKFFFNCTGKSLTSKDESEDEGSRRSRILVPDSSGNLVIFLTYYCFLLSTFITSWYEINYQKKSP